MARTPLTLITGPLGSGKTTLLRYILDAIPKRIAILMNEFGELAIDSKIVTGRNVQLAELGGGCVCCSLIGEFEAAVDEIIETINPEIIILETTGVAEPDALVFTIQEDLPPVRLDGVITIADADALVRFPQLGHTTRMQIEAADIILLSKSDLVSARDLEREKARLAEINPAAPVLYTRHCRVDPDLLFGIGQERPAAPPEHIHQPEFQSFIYTGDKMLRRDCFAGVHLSSAPVAVEVAVRGGPRGPRVAVGAAVAPTIVRIVEVDSYRGGAIVGGTSVGGERRRLHAP
jgi:G3E family GTPase